MRNRIKWFLVPSTVVGFVLVAGHVRADQVVYFSNGKAIVVKSAEKQDRFTILEMEGGGKIGVPTEQIARIEEYQQSVPPPQGVAAAQPPVAVTSPIAAAQAAAPAPPPAPPQGAPQAANPVPGAPQAQVMVPGGGGVPATAAAAPPLGQEPNLNGPGGAGRLATPPRPGGQQGVYGGGRYGNMRGGPMLSAGAGAGGHGNMGGRTGLRPRADRLGPRGSQVGQPPSGSGGASLPGPGKSAPADERPAPPPDPEPEEVAPASDEPTTEPEPEEEPNPDTPPAEPQED